MVPQHGTPLTVRVVGPSEDGCVWVLLAGDVDMAAEPALADVVDRLDGRAVCRVDIDLGAVTFAGVTLVHFIEAIHGAHPNAALELHRPSPVTRQVIRVTGVDRFVARATTPCHPCWHRLQGRWRTTSSLFPRKASHAPSTTKCSTMCSTMW